MRVTPSLEALEEAVAGLRKVSAEMESGKATLDEVREKSLMHDRTGRNATRHIRESFRVMSLSRRGERSQEIAQPPAESRPDLSELPDLDIETWPK